MTELRRGMLKVTKKGKGSMVQVLIDGKPFNLAQGQLSSNLTPTDGLEVEFVRVGGQPQQVRAVGKDFVAQQAMAQRTHNSGKRREQEQRPRITGHQQSHEGRTQVAEQKEQTSANPKKDFHNPYNFVPAPPRNTNHPELGDHCPVRQDAFDPQRYPRRIRVRVIAPTPLRGPDPDPAKVDEDNNGHKTFHLRVDANDLPAIPPSSVRGMLRSAYEAVTNSRFGRFPAIHKTRLMHRESIKPFRKVEFQASAWDLLDESLRPPATIDKLSPADRVFGWVRDPDSQSNQKAKNQRVAARGLLRVGPVFCESHIANAVESFPCPGLPLAILSTPKPQQGRFYVAKSPDGDAQDDGLSKVQAGYSLGKGLRGRKVYPHQHGLPDTHWENPTEDRTQLGTDPSANYQEYRRPQKNAQEQRDDQNRSFLSWVKPGAEFTFDLHVQNLSKVELGALLWLLTLPVDHFFRFGGGKPLGIGSVRLTIDECDVLTGDELRSRYTAWHTENPPAGPCETVIQAFKEALSDAYPPTKHGSGFNDISFIRAFLVACQGFQNNQGRPSNLPIHYPRATTDGQPGPPNPDGESFRWFVANEKSGARYALRDLSTDNGLPTLPDPAHGQGGQRPSRRR